MGSMQKISEYADSYCCPIKQGIDIGNSRTNRDYRCAQSCKTGCQVPYEKQPVGGKSQEMARMQARCNFIHKSCDRTINLSGLATMGLPVYDQDYVATVFRQVDCGKLPQQINYNLPPHSRDHAHRQCLVADHIGGQGRKIVYRTTMVDPLYPPVQPLSVPEVHKLRYMTNEYMTADDWY